MDSNYKQGPVCQQGRSMIEAIEFSVSSVVRDSETKLLPFRRWVEQLSFLTCNNPTCNKACRTQVRFDYDPTHNQDFAIREERSCVILARERHARNVRPCPGCWVVKFFMCHPSASRHEDFPVRQDRRRVFCALLSSHWEQA